MFKTRLISGIVLVIIALATIISGSWILFFTLLAVSLMIGSYIVVYVNGLRGFHDPLHQRHALGRYL